MVLLPGLLFACIPDPGSPRGPSDAPDDVPFTDVPHTEVPHVNHGPAGDGIPNPNAPVEPPPGVEPPPVRGPDDAEPSPQPEADTPSAELRVPSSYTLLSEPDPGWSSLPPEQRVVLRGIVHTLDRGEVRVSTKTQKGWKILDFGPVDGKRFELSVPRDYPEPLYLSVCSDARGDGPTADDPVGALGEPVRVGEEDLAVEITVGSLPDWTREQPIDVRALLTRSSVAP